MQLVYLILTAIALYVLSDRILNWMERRAGRRFEQRSVVFFGLMLAFSLIAFSLIGYLTGGE